MNIFLLAKSLGYKKVNGEFSHNQCIFKNNKKNDYISYDCDSHNGGFWKRAKSINDLRSPNKRSTWNKELSIKIKG